MLYVDYDLYRNSIDLFTIKYIFQYNIKEVIQLARKKKETELSPEEERRLEITKKLNKEQKLFCYHFIVEDKSMKDAYKAAYP